MEKEFCQIVWSTQYLATLLSFWKYKFLIFNLGLLCYYFAETFLI